MTHGADEQGSVTSYMEGIGLEAGGSDSEELTGEPTDTETEDKGEGEESADEEESEGTDESDEDDEESEPTFLDELDQSVTTIEGARTAWKKQMGTVKAQREADAKAVAEAQKVQQIGDALFDEEKGPTVLIPFVTALLTRHGMEPGELAERVVALLKSEGKYVEPEEEPDMESWTTEQVRAYEREQADKRHKKEMAKQKAEFDKAQTQATGGPDLNAAFSKAAKAIAAEESGFKVTREHLAEVVRNYPNIEAKNLRSALNLVISKELLKHHKAELLKSLPKGPEITKQKAPKEEVKPRKEGEALSTQDYMDLVGVKT